MSRQQFLAELTQYLTFVTADEREQILAVFDEKFDSVGPEGEASLLMELGTPMSIAIALKRRKEAGELIVSDDAQSQESAGDDCSPEEPPAAAEEEIPEPEARPEPAPVPEVVPEAVAELELESPLVREAAEEPIDYEPFEELSDPEPAPEDTPVIPGISTAGSSPRIERESPPPRKKLSVGGAIGAVLLSIIATAVLLIPTAAGGYLIAVMGSFVIAALRTMSTLKESLWMLCLGFAVGALGLLICWFFLQLIIKTIHRLFIGEALEGSRYKRGMKKAWKTIWIIFAVFLVLGIAAGIISYVMGGRPNDLFENSVTSSALDWATGNGLINSITGLFK